MTIPGQLFVSHSLAFSQWGYAWASKTRILVFVAVLNTRFMISMHIIVMITSKKHIYANGVTSQVFKDSVKSSCTFTLHLTFCVPINLKKNLISNICTLWYSFWSTP